MFELPAAIPVAIGTFDALIVVFYLAATTLLGIWLGRGQKNNRDYFLAGHKLPTWSLLLSIYTAVAVAWLKGRYRELQPYVIATLMVAPLVARAAGAVSWLMVTVIGRL